MCECVCLPEVLAQGRRVVGQQRVDQAEQLHDPLVLPQVLVALQQEHELVAVAACRGRHRNTTVRRGESLRPGHSWMWQVVSFTPPQQLINDFIRSPSLTLQPD